MSTMERTGWRDAALSERHRLYGEDCPMVDIDFLACEYDRSKASAIIEYKSWDMPRRPDFSQANYRTLADLADRAGLPFFVAVYYSTLWSYTLYPGNGHAHGLAKDGERLTELEYVNRLYTLRNRELPADLEYQLNDLLPEEIGL